jgi:hypothetical protein
MINYLLVILAVSGLPIGYLITHLSFDECKGKNRFLGYLLIPFIVLLILNLNILINTLLLFIISHLIGGLLYLRCNK